MSFIDKISVGINGSRSTFNLSQDTHTTAEIGYLQPTFCRMVVPGSHMEISSRNLVRLSPMAVPTMGRMSLRNYYYFVDLATLWTPFDAMRNQTNYTYGDGTVSTPGSCPYFRNEDLFFNLFRADRGIDALNSSIYATVYDTDTGEIVNDTGTGFDFNTDVSIAGDFTDFSPLVLRTNTKTWLKVQDVDDGHIAPIYHDVTSGDTQLGDVSKYSVQVSNQNADFSIKHGKFMILCKFIGASKRLRKQFIGAGYSFNPYDTEVVTPFKLMAIYKAYFDTFAVQRTINFNHTNCYKLIKRLSETYSYDTDIFGIGDSSYNPTGSETIDLFMGMMKDLSDICYNLPADYFSASDISAQRGAYATNVNYYHQNTELNSLTYGAGTTTSQVGASASFQQTPSTTGSTAQGMQLAERLLKYINKRSVVGRKIADLLKLNNEVDLHNNEHETVHHLGDDKVDIQISDVMSLASTDDASLGDYAGRAIGMGNTDTFNYDTKAYGILLCLSAIVPQSGYFQGILRENSDVDRFDFFTSEFDALGYQSLRMNELVSDTQFVNSNGYNSAGTEHGIFGITPRYQHLKVGRNICNGDISLPSMQSVMLPYSLDRHFITCAPLSGSKYDYQTVVLPTNQPETFRRITAQGYGDYNRIFQYVPGDYDHFIIQSVIDCKVTSPMKSISNSYDTFDEEVDNTTLQVDKQ